MLTISLRSGGTALKQSRLESGFLTLLAVVQKSAELWGPKDKLTQADVSRIENGRTERPAAEMLGKMSALYRVPIEKIFQWYGYPYFGGVSPSMDERLMFAQSVADSLPAGKREMLYDNILLQAQLANFQHSTSTETKAVSR